MEKEEIIKNIYNSMVTVLEHSDFELSDDTTTKDVDGWESITHMMIINEIEKTFLIRFDLMDLMNMNNVGDLIKMVNKKLVLKKNGN